MNHASEFPCAVDHVYVIHHLCSLLRARVERRARSLGRQIHRPAASGHGQSAGDQEGDVQILHPTAPSTSSQGIWTL